MSQLYLKLIEKYNINDDLLFHYTNADTAFSKILYKKQIRFSPFRKMNDPVEFMLPPLNAASDVGVSWTAVNKILDDADLARHRRINNVFVACFSIGFFEPGQDLYDCFHYKGWARSRMWAQYAKSHTGVCMIFDKNKLSESINTKVYAINNLTFEEGEILYSNDIKGFKKEMMPDITSDTVHRDYSDFYISGKERFLFQKIEDYKNEQEYRFILIDKEAPPREDFYYVDCNDAIVGLIMGCDFDMAYLPMIQHYRDSCPLEVFSCCWDFGEPRLSQF